jgi:hypothetical protein
VTNFGINEEIATSIAGNTVMIDPMDRITTGEAISIETMKQYVVNTMWPIEAAKFKTPTTAKMF